MENVSLKEYFDAQINSVRELIKEKEEKYQVRFDGQNEAIRQADISLKAYKEQANEWRAQSKDRESNFLSKDTFAQFQKTVEGMQGQITELETTGGENKGRRDGGAAMWALVLTLGGLFIAAVGIFIKLK